MVGLDDPIAPGEELASGVTHVTNVAPRDSALHRLTLAYLRENPGRVFWIDARDTAATYTFYSLSPSDRSLASIRIARAWTAYQHHTLVRQLVDIVTPRTQLIVLPNVYSLYTDDDLSETAAEQLARSSLTTVAALTTTHDIPAVITTPTVDSSPIDQFVDHVLRWEPPVTIDAACWQTTIPYWTERIGTLDERRPNSTDRFVRNRPGQQASLAIDH